ncbi:hypothetical protein MTF66_05200 [Pseudoalteromonas sp. 2CM39R]|uniref:hypothetical protein n=1 Tax=Pseudoalteromonas TaxID=53246 RepID=UPI001EFCB392|nr:MULTISPECIES: hypothetical protein [Pseudoalteromonas]MCG9736074.1 hypothetical protein [Pseudoalteromonas shioyasakiensis]MCK8124384.1 hypothetical protein [Pseudoalteromonas sp. 2CM39R]
MKVILLSAAMGRGVSSKSGAAKPYSFSSISYLVPEKDFIQGDHNIQKCGFEPKSLSMREDQALYNKFKKITEEQGICEVDLTLEPDPENMSRNIVSDVKLVS